MSLRKKAIKEWPDKKVREYLNSQFPNEKITWFTSSEESLYGFKANDGSEFVEADDDDIRNTGIIEFLKRNGGVYEAG